MSYQDHVAYANMRGLSRFSYTSVNGNKKTYYRVGDTGLFSADQTMLGGGSRYSDAKRRAAKAAAKKAKAKAYRQAKRGTIVGCKTKTYTMRRKNFVGPSRYKRCVGTTDSNQKSKQCSSYERHKGNKRMSCRKIKTCAMSSKGKGLRCKLRTGYESSDGKCEIQKSGRCRLKKALKIKEAKVKKQAAVQNKKATQEVQTLEKKLKKAKQHKKRVQSQNKKQIKQVATQIKSVKSTTPKKKKATKKSTTKTGGAPKKVYTRGGKCRDGYVKYGKKLKSGDHEGEYRCKKSKK